MRDPARSARERLCCLLLALLLTLLCCAGCGSRSVPVSAPDASLSSSAEETPEVVEEDETEVPEETDWRPEQAVTVLTAFSGTSVPSMADLGDGQVLCCWTEYSYDGDDSNTTACILDLAGDEVVRTVSFGQDLSLVRMLSDGSALMISYERECFYLLDQSLHLSRREVPDMNGQFSLDGSQYYYENEGYLYAVDLSDGSTSRISLEHDLRLGYLDEILPGRDVLNCWVRTSLYDYSQCSALVDAQSGALLLLDPDIADVTCAESSFYAWEMVLDVDGYQLFFGPLEGDGPLYRYTIEEAENEYCELSLLSGSSYVLSTVYHWDAETGEDTGETESLLYRMGADGTVDAADLDSYDLTSTLYTAVYLPEQDLILGAVYADSACQLLIIDPSQLIFDHQGQAEGTDADARIDSETLEAYLEEQAPVEVSESLSEARARADVLEETYGVTILLGEQCVGPCEASGYYVTTTGEASLSDESATVLQALEDLDEALSLYPKDFFSQFRTETGEDGVYIMLTGPIGSDYNMDVAAFEFGIESREYIGVDITDVYADLPQNYCHELWHATENKIFDTDFYAFYDGTWDECNPDGFEYFYSYDYLDYYWEAEAYTYFSGAEEVYFVDSYSQSYDKEDRARIMEYIMTDDDVAQELMQYPAIRQKLQIMCDGIEAAFDTTGWSDVRWERFF